jgi:hypothetical protein
MRDAATFAIMSPTRFGAALALPFLVACASQAPPPTAPIAATTELTSAAVPVSAVAEDANALVREDTRIVTPRADPDYTARAEIDAEQVFASMHADLQACYATRVRERSRAHAFMTMDVVVGPDGHVLDVATTGGALLGDRTLRCMTDRVRSATFEAPRGGGTLHVRVPFSMRRVVPGEEP